MSAGRKETIIAGVAGIVPVTWLALKLDDKSSLAPAESSLEFILDDEEGFRWAGNMTSRLMNCFPSKRRRTRSSRPPI